MTSNSSDSDLTKIDVCAIIRQIFFEFDSIQYEFTDDCADAREYIRKRLKAIRKNGPDNFDASKLQVQKAIMSQIELMENEFDTERRVTLERIKEMHRIFEDKFNASVDDVWQYEDEAEDGDDDGESDSSGDSGMDVEEDLYDEVYDHDDYGVRGEPEQEDMNMDVGERDMSPLLMTLEFPMAIDGHLHSLFKHPNDCRHLPCNLLEGTDIGVSSRLAIHDVIYNGRSRSEVSSSCSRWK